MEELEFERLQQFVPQVHFEQIPIKNLVSNQEYQRHLSSKHVKRAAENYDPCQVNPVKVSRRNGVNYVFNGQHTVEIIARVSNSRETPVWCMIYDELDYTQEADIFANQMKYVKSLLPYEVFMANIEAGNDQQLIIKDLVESYGLTISHKKAPACICAVFTLERIYEKYGYQVLDRTLLLCIGAWEGIADSFSSNMLNGVAKLISCYENTLKDNLFKERLGRVSIREISRTARERKAGSVGYAEAMLLIYNKKLHNPLRFDLLYTKKLKRIYIDEDNTAIDANGSVLSEDAPSP